VTGDWPDRFQLSQIEAIFAFLWENATRNGARKEAKVEDLYLAIAGEDGRERGELADAGEDDADAVAVALQAFGQSVRCALLEVRHAAEVENDSLLLSNHGGPETRHEALRRRS